MQNVTLPESITINLYNRPESNNLSGSLKGYDYLSLYWFRRHFEQNVSNRINLKIDRFSNKTRWYHTLYTSTSITNAIRQVLSKLNHLTINFLINRLKIGWVFTIRSFRSNCTMLKWMRRVLPEFFFIYLILILIRSSILAVSTYQERSRHCWHIYPYKYVVTFSWVSSLLLFCRVLVLNVKPNKKHFRFQNFDFMFDWLVCEIYMLAWNVPLLWPYCLFPNWPNYP